MEKLFNIRRPILIQGESGTGKSYRARQLHRKSETASRLFITVDLASISENLIESELFGHVKGAFTGAHLNKVGYVEQVSNGTLFLDEVGELSLASQKKLLLLLEENKYSQVGSVDQKFFRGRIIAATNQNLKDMVEKGTFREDLYYRLNVFSLEAQPLRKNKTKLRELINTFYDEYKNSEEFKEKQFSKEVEAFLNNYNWPGNIRELKNCFEYLFYMSELNIITMKDLPSWIDQNCEAQPSSVGIYDCLSYKEALAAFEFQYLNEALNKYCGRINLASRMIEMNKTTLIAKVRKYGINTHKIKAIEYARECKRVI